MSVLIGKTAHQGHVMADRQFHFQVFKLSGKWRNRNLSNRIVKYFISWTKIKTELFISPTYSQTRSENSPTVKKKKKKEKKRTSLLHSIIHIHFKLPISSNKNYVYCTLIPLILMEVEGQPFKREPKVPKESRAMLTDTFR